MINRDTYDLLSWLGDIGGLTDALFLIGSFLLSPFKKFKSSSYLLQTLFRYQPSDNRPTVPVDDGGTDRLYREKSFRAQFSIKNQLGEALRNDDVVKHLNRNFMSKKNVTPLNFGRYCLSYLTCCCPKKDPVSRRYDKFI